MKIFCYLLAVKIIELTINNNKHSTAIPKYASYDINNINIRTNQSIGCINR